MDGRDEDIWRKRRLRSTPTNVAASVILEGEDYDLKAGINDSRQ